MTTKRHHTIITGTGRAGTTFLVELLTRLGLETGFRPDRMSIDKRAFSGLERSIRKRTAPYIAKDPANSKYLRELLASGNVVIDHAIIPVRDFEAAANSRVRVTELARGRNEVRANGGLWLTDDPTEQISVLYEQFSILMETLARQPNVHVKVSEFGLKDRAWDYESNRRVVLDAIAIFGIERAIFATNFPVAGLRVEYDALVSAISRMLGQLPSEQCDRFFWKNAKTFYRL